MGHPRVYSTYLAAGDRIRVEPLDIRRRSSDYYIKSTAEELGITEPLVESAYNLRDSVDTVVRKVWRAKRKYPPQRGRVYSYTTLVIYTEAGVLIATTASKQMIAKAGLGRPVPTGRR
jgi:hypothetical protein